MDNEDLKFININPWDIPKMYSNLQVRAVLEQITKMEPGEVVLVVCPPQEVRLLRSSVWRQIRRHELEAKVIVREGRMYLKKNQPNEN